MENQAAEEKGLLAGEVMIGTGTLSGGNFSGRYPGKNC